MALPIEPAVISYLSGFQRIYLLFHHTGPGALRTDSGRSSRHPRLRSERAQGQSPDRGRAAFRPFLRRIQAALSGRWRARWPHLRHHRRQAGWSQKSWRWRAQPGRHESADRSQRRVEADVQRSLAAGARLFLRRGHERRGLGKNARQVCPVAALRLPTATA